MTTPDFKSPEALADWLESLHESDEAGTVSNRKWAPAQLAATAVRASLRQPTVTVTVTAAAIQAFQLAEQGFGERMQARGVLFDPALGVEAGLLAALPHLECTHPARSGVVMDEEARDVLVTAIAAEKKEWAGDFRIAAHEALRGALEKFDAARKGERHER